MSSNSGANAIGVSTPADGTDDDDNQTSTLVKTAIVTGIVVYLWVIAGIIAFIVSIACVKNSTFKQNILGLSLAIFTGPFYFLIFLDKSYCKSTFV